MDSTGWNARYAGSEYIWTVEVNQFVERHLAELAAGTQLISAPARVATRSGSRSAAGG